MKEARKEREVEVERACSPVTGLPDPDLCDAAAEHHCAKGTDMNGRSTTVMTAVLSGLGWGVLSFAVSVPVRAGLYDERMFSGGNLGTFAVVTTAATAATWYGINRHHTRPTN